MTEHANYDFRTAAAIYAADPSTASLVTEYAQELLKLATERGFTIDRPSWLYGFAEGLTFTVRHPELAGYYHNLIVTTRESPGLCDILEKNRKDGS